MIIRDQNTMFLDWELALWGDPVADVAIHLHKVAYPPSEQQQFLASWITAEPDAITERWKHDLQTYLTHENIKSAFVDSVRYAKLLAAGTQSPTDEHTLVHKLTGKLSAAVSVWHTLAPQAAHVEAALRKPGKTGSITYVSE